MEEGSLFQRMKHLFQGEDEMDEGAQKEAAGLIHNIIRYMDKDAKDIMTHRKRSILSSGSYIFGRQCHVIWMKSSARSPFGNLQDT